VASNDPEAQGRMDSERREHLAVAPGGARPTIQTYFSWLLEVRRVRARQRDDRQFRAVVRFIAIVATMGTFFLAVVLIAWIELVAMDMVDRERDHLRHLSKMPEANRYEQ